VSVPRKPDTDKILAHIEALKAEPWLGQARKWWPDYLFRFDHIEAAAKILNSGKLLCRAKATAAGVMSADCASPRVIGATAESWKQYARLYFRPRTPTQYDSEGFRPPDRRVLDAHCPIPVVMLFHADKILVRGDAEFSEGNLAANPSTGNDAEFLKNIPFKNVYHDTWFDASQRGTIIFHRHAEVIVPDELDLSALAFVGCRTQAEYETLLHLLEPTTRRKWSTIIGLGAEKNLHLRRWTFVEQVQLTRTNIRIQFNPSTLTPGPFRVRVEVQEIATGTNYLLEKNSYTANDVLEVGLGSLRRPEKYIVRLTLDGLLAYANRYDETRRPV
jgi:ssDNA thymidine ADP-ribosyltransferase, DarT